MSKQQKPDAALRVAVVATRMGAQYAREASSLEEHNERLQRIATELATAILDQDYTERLHPELGLGGGVARVIEAFSPETRQYLERVKGDVNSEQSC